MNDFQEKMQEIYTLVLDDMEYAHNQNHYENPASSKYPFFSSLNQEQKEMYKEITKRIVIDTMSSVFSAIDEIDDVELKIKKTTIENSNELFLISESNLYNGHLPKVLF